MPLRYFKPHEFTMDGKPVFNQMNAEFLQKLDTCRHNADTSFVISSSYRSPAKNKKVGGAPGSYHLKGRAVDLACTMGPERAKIIKAALSLGLSVGIMENGIHLDDRPDQIVFHYYANYKKK